MSETRDVAIERLDGDQRRDARDIVVVEAPLQLRARGTPVATIMRTPGNDLELVRGLLHAEGIRAAAAQVDEDAVDIDTDGSAFVGRGVLSSAACGVCGRAAIADLELRAREVSSDLKATPSALAALPALLRATQAAFDQTGGLHAAGLFSVGREPALLAAREDVGRHNAVDKVIGWALDAGVAGSACALMLSGRAGYELVQKAIMFQVPIVVSVSAPSSLAIELAERFNVALVGFVRGDRANIYAHGWRISGG
ncbi:MAG TPA: formate dehydrogenase accessory sulfurtransferase FdhD [Kofleriaceae bacterium]|jgi:FdhD protein